jgi:hypothetical protein
LLRIAHTSTDRSTCFILPWKLPSALSGDTYTIIYYFNMPEICEKQKQNKKNQDAIEIRKNLSK